MSNLSFLRFHLMTCNVSWMITTFHHADFQIHDVVLLYTLQYLTFIRLDMIQWFWFCSGLNREEARVGWADINSRSDHLFFGGLGLVVWSGEQALGLQMLPDCSPCLRCAATLTLDKLHQIAELSSESRRRPDSRAYRSFRGLKCRPGVHWCMCVHLCCTWHTDHECNDVVLNLFSRSTPAASHIIHNNILC